MTVALGLLYITPHRARAEGLPNRPRALLEAFASGGAFKRTLVVNRVRPGAFAQARVGRLGADLMRRSTLAPGVTLAEHPWPIGSLEGRALARLAAQTMAADVDALIVWVADPQSGRVIEQLADHRPPGLITVLDAYDAWDLSPLFAGRWRRAGVRRGYIAAARADVVFTNTRFMVERMRGLGAQNVHLLPNGAPPTPPLVRTSSDPYLLYIGRIHERVDTDILISVADAYPQIPLRIVGPIERQPRGWTELTRRTAVRIEPAVTGAAAQHLIAEARALLIPHIVDDYTLSQDSMKAWDALALGTPVVGTAIPPMVGWPSGTAIIAGDRISFVVGVGRVLAGELDPGRERRIELARLNGWDMRAAEAIRVIMQTRGR